MRDCHCLNFQGATARFGSLVLSGEYEPRHLSKMKKYCHVGWPLNVSNRTRSQCCRRVECRKRLSPDLPGPASAPTLDGGFGLKHLEPQRPDRRQEGRDVDCPLI